MSTTIFTAGQLALIILINIVGATVFLFFLWRRLREDYPKETIFSLGFYILGGIAVGFAISHFLIAPHAPRLYFFNPKGLWFWGSFIGGAVALGISLARFKMRVFEVVEAVSIGLASWFFILLGSFGLIYKSATILVFCVMVAVLIFLFFFLDKRYKTFSWYKSGKVGFSGLAFLALFFLARAGIAIADPSMLSFIGKIDSLISAILSFIFFLSIYNLSGKYE